MKEKEVVYSYPCIVAHEKSTYNLNYNGEFQINVYVER